MNDQVNTIQHESANMIVLHLYTVWAYGLQRYTVNNQTSGITVKKPENRYYGKTARNTTIPGKKSLYRY